MDLGTRVHIDEDDSDDTEDGSRMPSQSDHGGRGTMTRKRRRGIIEKRRRDRINSCLSELKRLVPTAFEKQGSQKLEKAEILQMTVEHLRFIHAKGTDSLLYDTQRVAGDYHSMGFRECVGEVSRYLTTVEGMDPHDPVRLRLLSHLQCCNAQRQTAINAWSTGQYSATPSSTWPPTSTILPKFEPTTAQYNASYASVTNLDLNSNGYGSSSLGALGSTSYPTATSMGISTGQTPAGSIRAPVTGPFQAIGNGSTGAGLNLNLTFLTPPSSAVSNNNSTSGSSLDKLGYGRNGWNADVSY